jgi:hypothetical protein
MANIGRRGWRWRRMICSRRRWQGEEHPPVPPASVPFLLVPPASVPVNGPAGTPGVQGMARQGRRGYREKGVILVPPASVPVS